MQPEKQRPPVFITGHPRSGSTLLASLFGRHKNLLSLPETHFFLASYAGRFYKRAQARKQKSAFLSYLLDRNVRLADLDVSKDEVAQVLEDTPHPSEKNVLDAVFAVKLRGTSKTRVVEKTPRHIEHIERILKWYPQSKIIIIVRDGRDAISSLLAVPWTHSNPRRHALYWAWCIKEAVRAQKKHPMAVKVVRYEDLLAKPEETVAALLAFVGEDYDAECLNAAAKSTVAPGWEADWKAASTGALNPENAYKWKRAEDAVAESWAGWMQPELALMGYEAPKKRAALPLRQWAYNHFYRFWRLYRTHISERKYRFRTSGS